MFRAVRAFVNRQRWLDSVGEPLQKFVNGTFSALGTPGKWLQNLLNGTWLGHPLHPLLTDVPVGAWTVTVVLGTVNLATGTTSYATDAEIALAVGLAAALGAVVTGATDWKDTYGEERTVGLLHGLTMVLVVVIFTVSLIVSLTASHPAGIVIAYVGYVLLGAGAYLGGHEVFGLGYGVNHTAFHQGPDEFAPVMTVADLEPGRLIRADAQGTGILLVRLDERIYALDDTCVHAGCSLAGGTLDGTSVVCPCHGSQYDLRDGAVINGPATMPQPHFEVRVQTGTIEVKRARI